MQNSASEIAKICESWWGRLSDSSKVEQRAYVMKLLALLDWDLPIPFSPRPAAERLNALTYLLRADGILSGFDTCQAYLGEWNEAVGATPTQEPAGDDGSLMTVRVVSFGVADPDAACPDASAEVAGVMRAVLADDFTALVRGRTLRITGESGTGLAFHTTSTTPDGS